MKTYQEKNSQKIADILIEDFHLYIAELVENMPKYRISGKNYRAISVGGGIFNFDVINILQVLYCYILIVRTVFSSL